MQAIISTISAWMLPCIIAAILVTGYVKKVSIYNTFINGAKSGFGTSIQLMPHLIAMMVAVQVFRASGAMGIIVHALSPLFHFFGIPPEVAPIGLLRPISGSASLAFMTDIFQHHGVDSWMGQLASTMQASSDTTLYVITVYFGSVGISNFRYSLKVGLLADLASVVFSVFAVTLLLGVPKF
ncbi:spore maturation protein [Alicyclobacillus sp. SO9]|uniref:spore maturation protein n=1 Tax=Alicyclobacillus sp. SO9 TaxID=2665646 RepID=UPI0018E77D16|nr:nucleoside recognition domain-containing protein [Alicyclobacillus sp. SO9]QQE76903.1 spore maturation protein [Alicyclobacillus sp. SO9]